MQRKGEEKKVQPKKDKSLEKFKEVRKYINRIDFLRFRNGNLIIKGG
jgi:hypothetical protein